MIKRPLILILGAYLTGMYLACKSLPFIIIILVMLAVLPVIYLLMYRIMNKFICSSDKFLWCLPFFFLLGYLSMKSQLVRPELYDRFDQEVTCEVTGRITMLVEKKKSTALYLKDNMVRLPDGSRYLCENVMVLCRKTDMEQEEPPVVDTGIDYLVGNKLIICGTLQKFSKAANPGQFDEELYYRIEDIDFKMMAEKINIIEHSHSEFHEILGKIKNKLVSVYDTILPKQEAGTLTAMLLGEKYLLSDEIKQLYQENGISHILAISGLHVSLIGMFIFHLLKKCKLPISAATIGSVLFIYSYGVLTNFSVSTNRAVVMMTVLLLSALIGKTYDILSALSLSALIILLQNPLQILSAGFLLSYGAVLGIVVLLPCLQKLFGSKKALLNSLFISASAQIATTPFILYFFYQLPVFSIVTNLIILPFVTILTLTSIFAGIAGAISMPLGIFLIGGSSYILKFYEWVCKIISKIPGNLITTGRPGTLSLVIYACLVVIFVLAVRKYGKKYLLFLPALAFVILVLPHPNKGLRITVLDVGQGDAIYMESKGGTTFFVDGGSADVKQVGYYRIQPFLLSQGTDLIDYAVITHSDNDHISGLKEMIELEKIEIKNLILPDISQKDKAYIELEDLAKEKDIGISYIKAGDIIKEGRLRITCLHPVPGYVPISNNSYSTVLSLTYGSFDMLLTGDLEKDGENMVTERLQNLKTTTNTDALTAPAVMYDVLKVAHHGSKNSTFMDFLRTIRPDISIISCGRNNRYGHPNRELLDRLEKVNSEIEITYDTGAITITTDGNTMKLDRYLTNVLTVP